MNTCGRFCATCTATKYTFDKESTRLFVNVNILKVQHILKITNFFLNHFDILKITKQEPPALTVLLANFDFPQYQLFLIMII